VSARSSDAVIDGRVGQLGSDIARLLGFGGIVRSARLLFCIELTELEIGVVSMVGVVVGG